MARVHRPPPPIPTEEHEEMEDNYGVWSDSEFDEPTEVYMNYEDDNPPDENSKDAGCDSDAEDDYEEPDESEPPPQRKPPGMPIPPRPVSPGPTPRPLPPRGGARPLPTPAPPVPPASTLKPTVNSRDGRVSPRNVPIPVDKRKLVPQPAPAMEDDPEETYEAVDSPLPVDDGDVYTECDEEPVRPVPKPGKQQQQMQQRALPPVPKPGGQRTSTASPKLMHPGVPKPSVSPQLGRREIPVPPPPGKSLPPVGRSMAQPKSLPQPSLPSPPPEEDEGLYEGGDLYEKKESLPSGITSKPLPRPPPNAREDTVEYEDDEEYSEVPESHPISARKSADRPMPPIPQPQPAFPSSGGGFPVEALKAGIERLTLAKLNNSKANAIKAAEVSRSDNFSENSFASAKKMLKPVNRGESTNLPERPKVVSVKRAESDNFRAMKESAEPKGSLFSEMKSKLEGKETNVGRLNAKPMPTIPHRSADSSFPVPPPVNNRSNQVGGAKSLPAPSEVPGRRQPPPKIELDDDDLPPPPPNIPQPRKSPLRSRKNDSPAPDSNLDSDSGSASSDKLRPSLDAHRSKERTPSATETNDRRGLPSVPGASDLAGLNSYGWYFDEVERQEAERKVTDLRQDGSFLVRKSKRGGDGNPYTLTVLCKSRVYNLHIRKRRDQKYALGTEKPDEHIFATVEDLISFHRNNPIEVVGDVRKNSLPEKVLLKASPRK